MFYFALSIFIHMVGLLVIVITSRVSALQVTPPPSSLLTRGIQQDTGTSSLCRRAQPRVFVLPESSSTSLHNGQAEVDADSKDVSVSDDAPGTTRRSFLLGGIFTSSLFIAQPADATVKGAKGAAEYDLEYYMRDLVRGNTKEGNLPASAPPPAPPARTLKGPLLPILLNDPFSDSCIPVQALADVSGKSASKIAELAMDYRAKSSKAFAAKAQWRVESISDQYFFDLSSYALWRTAADLIPDFVKRDKFARNVGRGIYREAKKAGLLKKKALQTEADSSDDDSSDDSSDDSGDDEGKNKNNKKTTTTKVGGKKTTAAKPDSSDDSSDDAPLGPLTGTIPAILEVLNLYNSTNFCSSYRLGGEDESRQGKDVFDELDDDDIKSGSSVDCLVSIYEPAILSAALQITGEGSRFSPDFVGATLAAVWEEAGVKASYESYFVDPVYRPNPKDFFPTERLIQFTLKKS